MQGQRDRITRGALTMPSNEKPDLWRVITSCGLEQDFEYDRKGRVIHKRTRLVVRADMSPER